MRWLNETVASLADLTGGVPMLAFVSLLATTIVALAWYFWPHWLPWRWAWATGAGRTGGARRGRSGSARRFRFGALRWRWRLRWRRRRKKSQPDAPELPDDELPELTSQALTLTADELAAAGRYAEAVRERLRAIVRELIEREVIPFRPGWTVTELAGAATQARPPLAAPLAVAVATFAEIWYGLRPATRDDDAAMREQTEAVRRLFAEPATAGR